MHNAPMSHAQNAAPQLNEAASSYFVRSYAKINLTLDVLGKRADGYHELVTVMQTVDLYDTLCLTITEEDGVRVICSRPELSNEENLVVRAAQAMRRWGPASPLFAPAPLLSCLRYSSGGDYHYPYRTCLPWRLHLVQMCHFS